MKRLIIALIFFAAMAKNVLPLPSVALVLRHHKIVAEVARTEKEREKGLMNRKKLPEDQGMLFIFRHAAVRYFWMKDTLIPLDIAFLDSNGRILTMKRMKALDKTIIRSEKPCRYALEMNKGFFKAIHAQVGDRIEGLPQ